MHFDLNLLVALDALLEEGSVSAAADRVGLSAPAMSRTLRRIREATGDEILVRTGRAMIPTPYALRVREQVHALVIEARDVLEPEHTLDLATTQRTFTLQGNEAVLAAIAPALLETVNHDAPGVTLRLLPEAANDTLDLKHGRVDLELGSAVPESPEIASTVLGHDDLVVALRNGHPLGDGRRLDLAAYATAGHVSVSRRGRLRDPIDDLLAAHALQRRVVATVGTVASALQVVARGDLIALLPRRTCAPLMRSLGVRSVELPMPLPPTPLIAAWHQRYTRDRGHQWLRETVTRAIQDL